MSALILLAHGSRNPAATREVAELAAQIGGADGLQRVTYAFLEMVRPTLQQAVAQLVSDNIVEMDVLPLFLNSGNHVLRDIPNLASDLREQYPQIGLRVLPHIGSHFGYTEFVAAAAGKRETAGS